MSFTYEERDVLLAELAEARSRADDLAARASEFYEALISAQARLAELEADKRRYWDLSLKQTEGWADSYGRELQLRARLTTVISLCDGYCGAESAPRDCMVCEIRTAATGGAE